MATAPRKIAAALASLLGATALMFAGGCSAGGAGGTPPKSGSGGATGTGGAATGGAGGGTGGGTATGSGGSAAIVDAAGTGGAQTEPKPDAGSSSNDGAAPGACQAMFCESFENVPAGSPPDPAIWTRTTDDIVVGETDGALGSKKALHITIVNGFKYIREKKTIPMMGTKFYGRVWFRIDRRPLEKPNGLFHWTLLSADEVDDYLKGKLIRFGGHIEGDLTNWLRFNFQTHGMPGETGLDDTSYTLDTKKWYCVEFYYSLPDQEARIWMNGEERPKLHWLKSVAGYTFPPSISQMSFGWAESHGIATPWEVWVDEIALDTKKIGCGN